MLRSQLLVAFVCLTLCIICVSGRSAKIAKKEWGKKALVEKLLKKSIEKRENIYVNSAQTISTLHPYGVRSRKAFLISAPQGQRIQLTFTSFDVDCRTDAVFIYDAAGFQNLLSGSMCGTIDQLQETVYTSTGNGMMVWFRSEQNPDAHHGFDINVMFVSGNEVLTPPSGGNQHRTYLITAPAGQIVQLVLSRVTIEDSVGCTADRLVIYDGGDATAPLRTTLCGTVNNTNLFSTGNQFYLEYTATNPGSYFYIEVVYHLPSEIECPSLLSVVTNSTLLSPGYVNNDYGNQRDCEWQVAAPAGKVLRITVVDMDIQSSTGTDICGNDWLAVIDGTEHVKMCGSNNLATDVYSSVNPVTLQFHSDASVSTGRWKILLEHWNV